MFALTNKLLHSSFELNFEYKLTVTEAFDNQIVTVTDLLVGLLVSTDDGPFQPDPVLKWFL
jgi:hypothetical protein